MDEMLGEFKGLLAEARGLATSLPHLMPLIHSTLGIATRSTPCLLNHRTSQRRILG